MEVKREEMTQEKWDEMRDMTKRLVCADCGGDLQIHTVPERDTLRIGCLNKEHHGYVERETYTQAMRRGEEVHPAIKSAIEKKMLPGGYPLGVALALIKTRFPRADLDDPSAALFVMDCLRLDLDPLLGEIVPVTFKVTDKETKEVRRIVQPILTEDGWLSLAARACPDRWAGPPKTEPITDKDFKKELCGDENAWVWKATGKTKDGNESTTYGWVKTSEIVKDTTKQTPKDTLPGNQARVRSIKRWVRETFPDAKAKMKEMTSEWLQRGKDVEGVHQIIEAEYHIVAELLPLKTGVGGEKAAAGAEEGKERTKVAVSPPTEAKTQKSAGAPPVVEAVEGEGFHIDLTWLNENLKIIKWDEETTKSWIASHFKVDTQGELPDVLSHLTREQAEQFVHEIQERATKQLGLFE